LHAELTLDLTWNRRRVVSDRALVEAAGRGDRAAFASLHRKYAAMVHAVLLARVPDGEAEDLVQDVFLKALRKIDTVQDGAAIGSWLGTLARHRAADFNRRSAKHAALPDAVTAPRRYAADAGEVLATIRGLPEAYSETLLMRLVEGMTGPEIAAATGRTPGSVRVNLHRGMQLLRTRLGGEDRQ